MSKTDTAPAASAIAVTPPPVRRGRRPAQVDEGLLKGMAELIANGDYAGDGIKYADSATANKAIATYKRALKDAGVTDELTSRTWGEDGEIQIALKRKS